MEPKREGGTEVQILCPPTIKKEKQYA